MSQITSAEFVVVGGGAVGLGCAHELAKAGKTDIIVVERAADVGLVTTSQGAGLCGQVRSSVERVHLAMHSVATFRELQRDPEVQPEWHEVGSLRIALTDARVEELRRLEKVCGHAGLEAGMISIEEAQRRWPPMDFSAVKGVLWCPSDGYMIPKSVAKSFEHQCRKLGVRFATSTSVERILCEDGRVTGVETSSGRIDCRYVINAAGANAYHVARLVGLDLPIVPVRHAYFVTVPLEGLHPGLPCFRVPELTLYGRVSDGGLLLGGWEPSAQDTDPRAYEVAESAPGAVPDWAVLDHFADRFATLFPGTRLAEKGRIGAGWPTFTPDGRFVIGESSQVKGFVMAGGCNAHGISGAAGIGRLLVRSLLGPYTASRGDVLGPDRFNDADWNWPEARRQARGIYETYYGA